jgi:AcrR family transcriptional regulator
MSDSTPVASRAADRNRRGGTTRRAQAARRRELLLAAALTLFTERGFRDTSVRDITRAAGVTEAVLYHYFANKVDLWTAVLAAYAPFARVADVLEGAAALPVDEALRRLGYELLRLLHERDRLMLALLSEAPAEPDVARVLERFMRSVTAALETFLVERQQRGEVAAGLDVRAAAHAFQGALLVRFLMTSLVSPAADVESDRAMVDALVAGLVHGLAPRGAP